MTYEELCEVNSQLETINIKGNPYVSVMSKVHGFRKLFPNGAITTEIIAIENGVVTIKAVVSDEDGKILGTGIAQEKEGDGYINKTSFIENCETSAIGRALSALGIGNKDYASANEVENAMNNRELATDKQKKELALASKKKGLDLLAILEGIGYIEGNKLTVEQFNKAMELLNEDKNKDKQD